MAWGVNGPEPLAVEPLLRSLALHTGPPLPGCGTERARDEEGL